MFGVCLRFSLAKWRSILKWGAGGGKKKNQHNPHQKTHKNPKRHHIRNPGKGINIHSWKDTIIFKTFSLGREREGVPGQIPERNHFTSYSLPLEFDICLSSF